MPTIHQIWAVELSLSLCWEGEAPSDSGEAVAPPLLRVQGSVEVPYLADENVDEDPEVRVTVRGGNGGPVERRMKEAFMAMGKPVVLEKIRTYVPSMAQGGPAKDDLEVKKPKATPALGSAGGLAAPASAAQAKGEAGEESKKKKKKKKGGTKEVFRMIFSQTCSFPSLPICAHKGTMRSLPEKPWFVAVTAAVVIAGALLISSFVRSGDRALLCSLSSGGGGSEGSVRAQLTETILHYATTGVTPQQPRAEIRISFDVLREQTPCNFLVFGLGHDSLMWTAFNPGGTTVFLEEDPKWEEDQREQPNERRVPATNKKKCSPVWWECRGCGER